MRKIFRFIISSVITLIELINNILFNSFIKDLYKIIDMTINIIKHNIINNKKVTDYTLFMALIIGVYLAYFLGKQFINNDYDIKASTSFVILLSSFIASLSMLKSIKHSDEQKKFDKVNILSEKIEKYTKEIITICKNNYHEKNIDSHEYEKILINLDYSVSRLKFLMSEYHEVTWGLENHLLDNFSTIVKMKIDIFIEGTLNLTPIVQDTLDDWSEISDEERKKMLINDLIKHRNLIHKQYKEITNI